MMVAAAAACCAALGLPPEATDAECMVARHRALLSRTHPRKI